MVLTATEVALLNATHLSSLQKFLFLVHDKDQVLVPTEPALYTTTVGQNENYIHAKGIAKLSLSVCLFKLAKATVQKMHFLD